MNRLVLILTLYFILPGNVYSQDNRSFKIFQFPPNRIPSIDGQTSD